MTLKKPLEIEDIIEGCIKKDRKAQEELYKRYFGLMMSISLRYCNDWEDAMEVVNNGFFKIFTKIENYSGKGSFEGWMRKTVVNTALDFLKSRKDFITSVDEINEYTADIFINNDAIDQLSEAEIIEVIQTLPHMSRTVFNMYIMEGYKHKEISEILNISEGTSHWHLQNARKLLKAKLEALYND